MQSDIKRTIGLWVVLTALLFAEGWIVVAELHEAASSQPFRQIVLPMPDR